MTLLDTPAGRLPVSAIASVEENDGPNQIGRENGRRRIVVYANTDGSDMNRVIADVREVLDEASLPSGYFVSLEGQFQAQEQASRLIMGLSLVSFTMMFLVLYSRYRSAVLAGVIMANIPLALIGSMVAMWLSGITLSVASMVGFITLAGIATRNGILKVSHYVNLCRLEGETFGQAMIVRGSLERLTPVLMTALVAAFALTPLLLAGDRARQGNSAPGRDRDLRRPGQLHAARHPVDARAVLAGRRAPDRAIAAVGGGARSGCGYARAGILNSR